VTASDVLHARAGNPEATLVGDLETGDGVPVGLYRCIILTQTLQCIGDPSAALRNIRKALAPDGIALVTLPCISPISRYDADRWGDHWRWTPQGAARLFSAAFLDGEFTVRAYGNRTTSAAFLFGLAAEELPRDAFRETDPDCPMLLGIRACRLGKG
jgi:SAM-dependent methyltransferase